MAKARAIAVIVVLVLLLSAIGPTYVMAAAAPHPVTPTNVSPANGTVDISLIPALESSPFSDPDGGSTHAASQWQIAGAADGFSILHGFPAPVFDSGIDDANLEGIDIPDGCLTYSTTYYWSVRHQDDTGWWSDWSSPTSFTTVAAGTAPHQPGNISPADGTTDIVLQPVLVSSEFSSLNGIGAHAGSQWQIASSEAGFAGPLYDSGVVTGSTQTTVPAEVLDYETIYYWRVRHQDSYGNWSAWSEPTGFTTGANRPPYQPRNVVPASGTDNLTLMAVLKASDFTDPDEGDSHAASQWRITATAGDYSSPVYDSDIDTGNLRQITVPAGVLESDTTYYWQVRYYDNYDNPSGWSTETSFSTRLLAAPVASFEAVGDVTEVAALTEAARFEDTSLGYGDIFLWKWDFGDGATETWNVYDYPRDLIATHTYTEGGDYTVTLTVTNSTGSDDATMDIHVVAAPTALMISLPQAERGAAMTFTDVSTGEITSWTWNFGDGSPAVVWDAAARAAADGKVTHEYSKAGDYVVTLTVSGPLGSNIANKQIEVTGTEPWFAWWMVVVAGGIVVAIAGAIYLRGRMRRKAEAKAAAVEGTTK